MPTTRGLTGNLWADLRGLLNDPRYPGRWVGYISYDVAHLVEPGKLTPPEVGGWPLVELGWCPAHSELGTCNGERGPRPPRVPVAEPRVPGSTFSREGYIAAVRRALGYIAAGDIFQVNLAQRFTTPFVGDPRDLYRRLAAISPAWYGAYLELGARGVGGGTAQRVICSTSPELFLQLRDGHVVTRPIKGTRPNLPGSASRLPGPELEALAASAKDTAELNMIVDLMRNDLGKVCSYGSVRVTNPREIESHPTVHHTTATIEGHLHPSMDVVDLLHAALPGGSITGAPKIRAMQIIAELEPAPRGPYTGCIGYLSRDEACLSVAIRTLLLTRNPEPGTRDSGEESAPSVSPVPGFSATFSAGSGIVADSDPAAEYDETLTKAQAMLRALAT